MFVSDSSLSFMGTKVHLISPEGFSWDAEVDPTATIDSIKRLAIQYFYPSEAFICPDHFRVIYPAESRTLDEHHALLEEHVKENEVLLFVRRRNAGGTQQLPGQRNKNDLETNVPTATEILAATQNLPEPARTLSHSPRQSPGHGHAHHVYSSLYDDSDLNVDFQMELRKIIVSLVSVMGTLLKGNPDAEHICKETYKRIQRRLKNTAGKNIEGTEFQYPPPPEIECNPMGCVVGLAEAKKREFSPNAKAVESLRAMGYKDEQIVDALRANKNVKEAAREWIVAGKGKADIEADDISGLDRNGHLYSALVSNPTVRLGLNDPKTLLAFLNILENPASANTWLHDGDTAPVLSAVFKIYHAEKHAAPVTDL